MPAFFGDWSSPNQRVVDPRKTIRLSWYYYTVEGDDVISHFKVFWKPANIKGWTDSSVKQARVNPGDYYYDLPPYSFALGQSFSWKVETWSVDRRWDPSLPDPQYYYESEEDTEGELVVGTPYFAADNHNVVDGTGYTLSAEANATVASGGAGTAVVHQIPFTPSDPGEYDVRISVENGFQWSNWSSIALLKQYDSRRWVRKAGIWWCIPTWKKTSGTMTEVIP